MNRFAIIYTSENGSDKFPFLNSKNQYHIYQTRRDAVEMMAVLIKTIKANIAGNPQRRQYYLGYEDVQTTFPTAEEIACWQHKLATMEIVEVSIKLL